MTRINGRNGRRAAAVAAGVATSLIVGGSAYAYFTGTGSGAGAAKVGVGDTILSVAVDPTTGPLFPSSPGGYKGDLRLTFTSPVAATVTGIARDMSRSVMVNGGVVGPTPCLGTVITLDTITGLNISVPATPGSFTTTIMGVVSMAFNAPASCQNASFSIPVILTGSAS